MEAKPSELYQKTLSFDLGVRMQNSYKFLVTYFSTSYATSLFICLLLFFFEFVYNVINSFQFFSRNPLKMSASRLQ